MGQGSLCYKRMKIAINSSGIVWSPNSRYDEENPDVVRKSWKNIINSATNLNYDAQTAELKEKWRRYFLYGMASHIITDTFSHSSYYLDNNLKYVWIEHHNGAHDVKNNRFICAGNSAFQVAVNSQLKYLGDVTDFSSKGESCWNGFYLGNILKYALESDIYNEGINYLTKEFGVINYSLQ